MSEVPKRAEKEAAMNYKQTVLKVSGMSCHSCVSHINEALTALGGVRRVEVRMSEGSVIVEHNPETIATETLVQVLEEDGYDAIAA